MLKPISEQGKKLIVDLIVDKITLKQFTQLYEEPITEQYIQNHLRLAVQEKNEDELWLVLTLIFRYVMANPQMLSLLEQALNADWHTSHEDIVSILEKLERPSSVQSLYEAATAQFSYLNYDDNYALARRCLWALGSINTEKAREMIKRLTHSGIEQTREYAQEQIERLKI